MILNFKNIPSFCSRIDLDRDDPSIDLSEVTFIEPSAIVYLGMFLRHFNSMGKYFEVRLPRDRKVRKYLADQQFWERFNFSDDLIMKEKRIRTFALSTSPGDIIDIEPSPQIAEQVAYEVYRILSWHPHVSRIGEIVSELVDNFAIHSAGSLAAFAMQWYPRGRRAIISIADCGLGIRQTLARNPQFRHLAKLPHMDAVIEAFRPLVSSRRSGGGTGLTEVQDAVQELNGRVRLTSGDGYVEYHPSGGFCGRTAFDLTEVQVEVIIPT